MPLFEIDLQFFKKMSILKPDASSHEITKGRLRYSDKVWFCKEVSDPLRARYEVLGQEFFRLIIASGQPETRVAKSSNGEKSFILSEEVAGFKPIPLNKKNRVNNGVYTGLGQILIASVFLHEIDLNLGNVAVDINNQFVKIDGDWSFASLVRPDLFASKPANITPALIKSLPHLTDYFAYNWLDINIMGKPYVDSDLFDHCLSNAPHFRAELNQALLNIIVLPEQYIRQFIKLYMPVNPEALVKVFLSRQAEMANSAMQDESFMAYIASPAVDKSMRDHVLHIQNFAANDWFPIIQPEEKNTLAQDVGARLSILRISCASSPKTVASVNDFETNTLDYFDTDKHLPLARNRHRLFSAEVSNAGSHILRLNRASTDLSSSIIGPVPGVNPYEQSSQSQNQDAEILIDDDLSMYF